jgi:alpha-tubulin suppressor-like RCC1 family protein
MNTYRWCVALLALSLTIPAMTKANDIDYVVTYANDFGTLDLQTGAFTRLGSVNGISSGSGYVGGISRLPGGVIYGNDDSDNLVTINPITVTTTIVGNIGNSVLGPMIRADGTLFGLSQANNGLYTINPSTGTPTLVAIITGPTLAGVQIDLRFDSASHAYLLANNSIYTLNTATGATTLVGATGFNLYGLDYESSQLYGFTEDGKIIRINTTTGAGTLVATESQSSPVVTGATATSPYGSLLVNISPAGAISAGAQWQVDGGALHSSGAVVPNLSLGSHTVSFTTVSGWTTPSSQIMTVNLGITNSTTGYYTANVGSLLVNISPAGAISAGAKWQVDGGALQSSGAVVPNLSVGSHTVSFTTVSGWLTPNNQTISVALGVTNSTTGYYTTNTGSLQVMINPAGAVSAGAKWQVDGGALQSSGAVVTNLPVGSHTVSCNSVTGWLMPSNQTVPIALGSNTTASATYTGIITQPQSLSVNAGQSASFTVTAAGTAPLTYQWYYNTNTALAGNTNTTLTLANVQTNQAGNYTVVLKDGYNRSVTSSVAVLTVVPPPKPPGIVIIAGGDDFSLYGNNAGNLWAMGDNYAGQLGDGTNNNIITVPELIVAGAGTALAAGNNHSLIIKTGGSLWAAGDNTDGQLGDGTYNSTNRPELIVSNNVTAVAAGFFHSLFIKSDGSLWAMGDNSFGQLGDGSTSNTNRPEMIVPSGVTAVSAGYRHSLFLKSDGSLWGIGGNNYGQLGDGTGNNALVPKQLLATNVTAIAAGGLHSLFIKSDGSLWAMGDNEDGELGDGTSNYETNQPEMIVPSGVTAVAAGFYHSLFLKTDGSLWSMGLNNYGQLGDGTFDPTNRPQLIVSNNVTAIAAGFYHSLYIKSDGSLWAMGFNEYGELGDGQLSNTNRPEQLVAGIVANGGIPYFTKPMFTNGCFQATLNGMALSNYVVYVSSNLVNWTTLKTVTATASGSTNVTDTSGILKLRFYRAKLGP